MISKLNRRLIGWIMVILILLAAVGVAGWFFFRSPDEAITIAVVGPMSGEDVSYGEEQVQGVSLCLEEVNQQGGINGRPVKILTFDDHSDEEQAVVAAQQAAHSQALVIIGHVFSFTSLKGGEVYRQAGLPAISGSATADPVTADNPWYFRVVPNNHAQAVFLANYAHRILNQPVVSIVYDQDAYGESLAEPFEDTIRGLGGQIRYKWGLDVVESDMETEIDRVINDLAQAKAGPPGLIFIATRAETATELIVWLKRKGLNYPIIGADTLGDASVGLGFAAYSEEQVRPGYFSDNIYAATPFIFDIAGVKSLWLENEFIKRYGVRPGWGAATNCDAALVAVEAIKRAGVEGRPETLAQERLRVRNALAAINSFDTAVAGVTGNIYFDPDRNTATPMALGVFSQQQFVSAMVQLQPVKDLKRVANLEQELQAERILLIDGHYMYRTNAVYTGLDFIEISNPDTKSSTFTADFYLWFRYRGEFDSDQVEFINAVQPLQLGDPVMETVDGEMTYRVYRLKGTFKVDFDFRDYPFDRQELRITLRHRTLTRENLVYVPDMVGMRYTSSQAAVDRLARTGAFKSVDSWQPEAVGFSQDMVKYDSTLGNPQFFGSSAEVEHSSFTASVLVKRDTMRFALKNFLPLMLLLVIAYLSFWLPPDLLPSRLGFGTGGLLTTAFFHLSLSNSLPNIGYVIAMEYVFYVTYLLYVIVIMTSLTSYVAFIKDKHSLAGRLNWLGQAVFLGVIVMGLFWLNYTYSFYELRRPAASAAATAQPTAAPVGAETSVSQDQVTLTLGSWRTDDREQMRRFLDQFHQAYPHITIQFEPTTSTQYNTVLETQLEQGTAPDLFYLRSYSLSRRLFEQGYLELLENLPGLAENFTPERRAPWATDDGRPYGVPFVAVSHGIYYNADIFKQLNLPEPTTWEELLATAQKLKDNGYIPFANGSGDRWTMGAIVFMNIAPNFIGGRAGRMEYLTGQRCFNDERMVAAFQAIADLAPFFPPNQAGLIYNDSQQLFLQGRAAMWLGGSWDISYFQAQNPPFTWQVMAVPPPAGQPGYVTFHPDAGIGLNSASAHKQEARLFLEWLVTPEAGALLAAELPGLFPLHTDAPPLDDSQASAFLALSQNRGTDIRFTWEKLMEKLPSGYDLVQAGAIDVLAGRQSPRQAADALQAGLGQWFQPAQQCLR